MTSAQKLQLVKDAVVARMNEVEPCALHAVPSADCAACKHDLFIAALIGIVTTSSTRARGGKG